MKKKIKKTFLQKIIIVMLMCILAINTIMPTVVYAGEADFGGVLFTPIQYLVITLGDVVMELVNVCSGVHAYPVHHLAEGSGFQIFAEEDEAVTRLINKAIMPSPNSYIGVWIVDGINDAFTYEAGDLPDNLEIPYFLVSPDTIFANEVAMLDVNIINPPEDSVAKSLQSGVSSWYYGLRNLAIVGLLSVLVYVAIRIIISSTAADKSKYKQMLVDWLVAFCLLFFMHYIMSFAITMTEVLTDAIKDNGMRTIALPLNIEECEDKYGEDDYPTLSYLSNDDGTIMTNLMGYVRFVAQTNQMQNLETGNNIMARSGAERMSYTIMYIVLVIYTVMFVFIYLKRLIYIIFLTMISPMVALTYPIDKMNDGKAQAFNTWLKEYIFNLLIQPLHLILYTMLVSTALAVAVDNLLYPLVVLGFLLQAEKVMRKLFGFEKSSTAGSMSGALGGALVMNGINALKSGAKGIGKAAAGGGKGSAPAIDGKINTADKRKADKGNDSDNLIKGAFGKELENKDASNIAPDFKEQASQQLEQEMKEMEEKARLDQSYKEYMNNPDAWQENRGKELEEELKKAYEEEQAQIRMDDTDDSNIDSANVEGALLDTDESDEKEPKANVLKGAKSLLGTYVGNNLGAIGKGALKGTTRAFGAATLGTIGVAAGLASDDYSKVFTYGLGAGAVGSGLGGKLGETAWNAPSNAYRKVEAVKDVYNKGAYSKDDYEKIKNKQLDDKFMKDKKIKEKYYEAFKKDEEKAKKAMKAALKYRSYGINDDEVIIKAMKAKSQYINEDDLDNQKRIVAAQLAQQVSNEKDIQTARDRLQEKGVKKEHAYDQAEMLRQIKDLV